MAQVSEEKKVETKALPWLMFGLVCALASAACVFSLHAIQVARESLKQTDNEASNNDPS